MGWHHVAIFSVMLVIIGVFLLLILRERFSNRKLLLNSPSFLPKNRYPKS